MEIQSLDNRDKVYLRVSAIRAWKRTHFYTNAKLARKANLWPSTVGNALRDGFATAKTVKRLLEVIDVDIINHRRHKNGKEETNG